MNALKKDKDLSEKSQLALWTCSKEGQKQLFEEARERLKEKEKGEKLSNPEFGEWQIAVPLKKLFHKRGKQVTSMNSHKKTVDVVVPVKYRVKYTVHKAGKDTLRIAPSAGNSCLLVKVEPIITDLVEIIGDMRAYKAVGLPILITYSLLSNAEKKALDRAGITVHSISKEKTKRFDRGRFYRAQL